MNRPASCSGRTATRGPSAEGTTSSWVALQRDLETQGCWFDVYSPQLVAVSAEPEVAQAVADFLADEQRAGRGVYETGRSLLPGARRRAFPWRSTAGTMAPSRGSPCGHASLTTPDVSSATA